MRVLATADLHGHLPDVPECDVLLIAGDVCPIEGSHAPEVQSGWLRKEFAPWLESVPAKHIVGIAGNHDYVFEDVFERRRVADLPWTYLQDSEVTVEGLRIYGTPWVPNLPGWAFHGGMANNCGDWRGIPEGIDVLMAHGPMYGYGDEVIGAGPVGCLGMRDAMRRIKPRVFVCGHIHEGRGHYPHRDVELGVYNVSHMNAMYDPDGPIVEIPIASDSETECSPEGVEA